MTGFNCSDLILDPKHGIFTSVFGIRIFSLEVSRIREFNRAGLHCPYRIINRNTA